MQPFISLFSLLHHYPPHYSDAYEQNPTDGTCFYELSPEIWFEISPVSSVLLSLQQMHLNVSNLFVACATTRAREERMRTVIGEAELPAQHPDPWTQRLHQPEESSVPAGAASEHTKINVVFSSRFKSVL